MYYLLCCCVGYYSRARARESAPSYSSRALYSTLLADAAVKRTSYISVGERDSSPIAYMVECGLEIIAALRLLLSNELLLWEIRRR
jgi:hypothetical protein